MTTAGPHRVVVTGAGVLAPGGVGIAQFLDTVFAGRSQVRHDPRMAALGLRSTASAPLPASAEALVDTVAGATGSRLAALSTAAAVMAVEHAGLDGTAYLRDAGFVFSSTLGGISAVQAEYERVTTEGKIPLRPVIAAPVFHDAVALDHVPAAFARDHGMNGICLAVSTGCSTGLDALGTAAEIVADGLAPLMLVGAADALLSDMPCAMMDSLGVLSRYAGPAEQASRPFDADRSGFVVSEGGSCLVLEDADHARDRDAHVYAEVAGFDSRMNGRHMTHLAADGQAMAEVVEGALTAAGTSPRAVDCVFAHGTGTRQNDVFETRAFHTVFGARAPDVPVISIKSVLGHAHAPANLQSVIAAFGAMERGMLPPTINITEPDPECDLDYVADHRRPATVTVALVTASGLGGYHSALVLRAPRDPS